MEEARDIRNAGWFWINNAILDAYAKDLGVYGIAVYALLAYRAGQKDKAWPSLRAMAKQLDIGLSSVQRSLEKLLELKLISRERRKTDAGDYTSNIYSLLPVTPHSAEGVPPENTPVPGENIRVPPENTPVPGENTKQDSLNKTHKEQEKIPPLAPPKGERSAPHTKVIATETLAVSAETVVQYLNAATGRRYSKPGLILARLRDGARVEECQLVIDWWKEVKIVADPSQDLHFTHTTPFRPDNFDKYRAAAEQWHARGRPAPHMQGGHTSNGLQSQGSPRHVPFLQGASDAGHNGRT